MLSRYLPSSQSYLSFRLGAGLAVLGVVSVAAFQSSLLPDEAVVLFSIITVLLVAAAIIVMRTWEWLEQRFLFFAARRLVEQETAFAVIADETGALIALSSKAAMDQGDAENLVSALSRKVRKYVADPADLLFRLQAIAHALGRASETLYTRSGVALISVMELRDGCYLWRVEGPSKEHEEQRDKDELAHMICGPTGTITYMNNLAKDLFCRRPASLEAALDGKLPPSGQIVRLKHARWRDALVLHRKMNGGRLEIFFLSTDFEPDIGRAPWSEVEDLPVPLLKLSAEGRVLAANRQARSLLQSDFREKCRLSEHVEGLGRPVNDWVREVSSRPVGSTDSEFMRGVGPVEDVFLEFRLVRIGDDQSPEVLAVLADRTDFKSLEAQFVQSQKMQAVGQLAGGVAHDFNNLLTAISGHCDLLLLRHLEDDEDYGDLMQIHANANRAAALVAQLLAFSRKQNLTLEVVRFEEVLPDVMHLLNRLVGEKIHLRTEHRGGSIKIRVDRRQLEQVIMNLVVNARDAMPAGGEILVTSSPHTLIEPMKRQRATVPAGDYLLVRVIDEGFGIPKEKLNKIFEPFYTTKPTGQGTGLGLSTVYGIVKQTGGFIFADSDPGAGAIFSLYFPVHRSDPAAEALDAFSLKNELEEKQKEALLATPEIIPDDDIREGGTILLVEDEAPVRNFAAKVLEGRGYSVVEAENGDAALEILEDETVQIDVFISDIVMPGSNGPTWVRQALTSRPDTRVIFISGYAQEPVAIEQSDIPGAVFLPKPFSLEKLADTVAAQFRVR